MNQANVLERMCKEIVNATTAIVLTHNIDFLFVESLLLPRLRSIGHPHLTIFADAVCASGSYGDQHDLIERLGISYRVVPVDLGGTRRFHPKAFFLCNDSKAALAVGSGNTTHGGWSANQEVWSDFIHPSGGGGSELAAFRDYLRAILSYVPEPESIARDTLAAFTDEKNTWCETLPAPSGLAWTPNANPMLTQIIDFVASEIRSIDVLSPYFDPEGAALTRLAEMSAGDVNVLLQPRRLGLSKGMAAKLPSSIHLRSIEDNNEERRYKFIHAKAYIFRTSTDCIIATGSANCSMAALLADSKWGNAELMSLSRSTHEIGSDLLSNFSVSDEAPELPDEDPTDDWKVQISDLRILAARRDGPRLEVHYKSAAPLVHLVLCSSEGEEEANRFDDRKASFTAKRGAGAIWLKGVMKDGLEVVSSPSWVDDEIALRTAGPERRIREKLEEAAEKGSLTGVEFLQILELFDFHVQKPVSAGTGRNQNDSGESPAPVRFTEDDIYSDGFAKPHPLINATAQTGFGEADTLALFLSFFQTKREGIRHSSPRTGSRDQEDEDENKEAEVKSPVDDAKAKAALGARVLRVLKRIEVAMARPEFISSRTASRLSADIAFISLLMTKSRVDGYISPEQFRAQTLAIWKSLFFGVDGTSGIVPRHLGQLGELEKTAFASELRSPKLSAAMALWGLMDWGTTTTDARYFRICAALLAARFFWLSQGGTPDEICGELDRIAAKLLPSNERERLFQIWADWVKDGQTVELLTAALTSRDQRDLARLCTRRSLKQGELVWQNGKGLCSVATACDRTGARDKVELIPINQAERLKVLTAFVAPLKEILASDIGVSDRVKRHVWFE